MNPITRCPNSCDAFYARRGRDPFYGAYAHRGYRRDRGAFYQT